MKKPKKKIFRVSGGLVFILILTFIVTGSTLAQVNHWTGGESDWNTAGNWDQKRVPIRGDDVLINTKGDLVSYNNPLNPTLRSLQLNDPDNDPTLDRPTLFQNALILSTEKTEIGLTAGDSYYNQKGGIHRILIGSLYNNTDPEKGNLNIGVGAGSFGNYDLLDAVLSVAGHENVGIAGEGKMNQDNCDDCNKVSASLQCVPPTNPPPVTPPPVEPIHSVGKNLYLGVEKGSDGQFNISAGSLTVGGSIRVGNSGTGMFDHRNSKVTIKGNDPEPLALENDTQLSNGGPFLNLRRKRASTPSLECHTSKNPGLIVGIKNQGIYNMEGGTLTVNYSEIIGWGAGGSFVDSETDEAYSSSFNQNFGTHKVMGNFIVAMNDEYPDPISYPYSSNFYSLFGISIYSLNVPPDADRGLLDIGGFASVGHRGYGEIYQDGGKVKVRGTDPELTNIGLRTASSPGTPTLQCHTIPREYIGLTIGRRGIVEEKNVQGGIGRYYLSNGELLVSRGEAIGVFGGSDGAFYHTSGSHYVGGALTIALLPQSKGFYQFLDGLLVARGGLVNNGTFEMYGGVVQAKVTNSSNFLVKKPAFLQPGQTGPALVGDFYNQDNATLAINGATVKFDKHVYNNGYLEILGDAAVTFKHLTINPAGYLTTGVVDPTTLTIIGDIINDSNIPAVVTVTGNLVNKSTRPAEWNMDSATLAFSGAGTHYFKTGNDAFGNWGTNFGWGALSVPNGALLRLQGPLYAKKINVQADGDRITNMFGYCGIKIFNNPATAGFPELSDKKLYSPWGRQVGHFDAAGLFVQDCP